MVKQCGLPSYMTSWQQLTGCGVVAKACLYVMRKVVVHTPSAVLKDDLQELGCWLYLILPQVIILQSLAGHLAGLKPAVQPYCVKCHG